MNKRLCLVFLTALTLGSFVMADIQAPPGSRYTWSRKLSRAIANIAYGGTEYNSVAVKSNHMDGSSAAFSSTIVQGTQRTVVRLGYGLFELVTFPAPVYHGTYKPPYDKREYMNPWFGYSEFPPQIGITTESGYCRGQRY